MPLDVARLRDSDLASDESPEACWAAVLIWAASWHQVPAASIPDNDNWIAKQAGYAQRGKIAKEWANVRTGALRGWVLCSDGRHYHPVVAEKARDAWKSKLEQRWKSECARIKKHNQRHGTNVLCPEFDAWIDAGRPQGHPLFVPEDKSDRPGDKPRDIASKRQGEGQRQGQRKRKGAKAPTSADTLPTWMQALIDLWHEVLPELPGVVVMNAERSQAANDFRNWVLTTLRRDGTPRATNDEEFLAWTRDYFQRARHNDFIMGRGPRSPDHPNWRCPFEWLLSAKGMQKVIEQTAEAA
ncbi:hypothetical protein ACQ858_08330 [Variovorax ureilyticus]|uniref:hypothetical protein n=1 Tax=Variovorax ureilyticus TaxID=1836198 RepID=UPI003D67BD9B